MGKILKFLLVLMAVAALLGLLLGLGFFNQLKEETDDLSKKGMRLWLSLSSRVEAVEDSLEVFFGQTDIPTDPAQTLPLPTEASGCESATKAVTEPPTAPEATVPPSPPEVTETVTAAETSPSEASSLTLIIRSHEGIIGVFDESGTPVWLVNVAVMTLPEADRTALAEGIVAASEEEALRILDRLT